MLVYCNAHLLGSRKASLPPDQLNLVSREDARTNHQAINVQSARRGQGLGAHGHSPVRSKSSRTNLISSYDRPTGHVDKVEAIDVIDLRPQQGFCFLPRDRLSDEPACYGSGQGSRTPGLSHRTGSQLPPRSPPLRSVASAR